MNALNLINDYFLSFAHPFRVQRFFRDLRTGFLSYEQMSWRRLSEMTTAEVIAISWVFAVFDGIHNLAGSIVGMKLGEYFATGQGIGWEFSAMEEGAQKLGIFLILVQVLFFPVFLWLYTKFWEVILRFFGDLYEIEGDCDKIASQIVRTSLTSHVFLLVPVFGRLAQQVSFFVFMFAGLRRNMNLTVIQSLLVLASPLLIIGLMMTLWAVSVAFTYSSMLMGWM